MTWLLKLLEQMSPQIAEAFQEMLHSGLQKLYEKALETGRQEDGTTTNPWDEWGIRMIAKVFGVELQEPE